MSSYQISYWRAWNIEEDINREARAEDYIIRIEINNRQTNKVFERIINLNSRDKLLGFIRYYALPSITLSMFNGNNHDEFTIGAFSREEICYLIDNKLEYSEELKIKWKSFYNKFYNSIDEVGKEEDFWGKVTELLKEISSNSLGEEDILFKIEGYRDFKGDLIA